MYSLRLALTSGFFSTRPGREPWERGWSCPLLWLGFTKAPCKRTQQCWISHVASVCTPTLLHVVGSCCTKFETGQTFIDVQTDATTPNMLGQQCWEFVRPFARQQWKENKIWEGYGSIKVLVFSFFIPAEPVIWLVFLWSLPKTKQSPLQILRVLVRPARPGKTLGNWNLSLPENVGVTQLTKPPEDSGYEEHIVTTSSFTDFVSFAAIFKNSHQTSIVYEYQ